jgi:hypothetical protein
MSGPKTLDLGPTVRVPLSIIQRVLDLVAIIKRYGTPASIETATEIDLILKPYDDPDAAQLDEIQRLGT